MAYKLYINNKLFNGIGNNNYNKGTIAINGTVYQYDNSSSSVTQFNIYYHYLQPESQAVNTYTVNDGYAILAADIPAMANTDYLLDGYYYDSSFTNPVTVGDIISNNTDIYLNWISKTYLYKVSKHWSNPSGTAYVIKQSDNDKYINNFHYMHKDNTEVAGGSTSASNTCVDSDDNTTILFTNVVGGEGRAGRTQSTVVDDRYFVINVKHNGKIKFFYRFASGTTGSQSNAATTIYINKYENNIVEANDSFATVSTTASNTVYETKYFTLSGNTQYVMYCGDKVARFLIAGFKFVAD